MYLGTCKVQKKVLDLLELELNAVISCLTWELEVKLWKNSTCSQLLSHLSRTKIFICSLHIRVILLVHALCNSEYRKHHVLFQILSITAAPLI